MRKSFHTTKSKLEREEKRRKRNIMYMSLFLIFILVSSLLGYAFFYTQGNTGSTSVEEYDTTFRIRNVDGQQLWAANFNGEESYFYVLPSQVEGYYSEDEALLRYVDSEGFTVTFDPLEIDANSAQALLTQFYESSNTKDVSVGVTQLGADFGNITQVTCADTTPSRPVVLLGLTNVTEDTGILLRDDCITVKGFTVQDVFYLTQKLRYAYLGIDFTKVIGE